MTGWRNHVEAEVFAARTPFVKVIWAVEPPLEVIIEKSVTVPIDAIVV